MEDITEKCKKSRLPEGEEYIFGKEAILQNDIKILEEQLKTYKRHLENYEKEDCLTSTYYELKKYAGALENVIAINKELEEYKKIAELTKVSCCTAQNCEALNNAIREGLENTKLKEKIEKLEKNYINPNKARFSYYDTGRGVEVVIEGFIPKSKVIEKIEELDETKQYWTEEVIQILQELLNKGE